MTLRAYLRREDGLVRGVFWIVLVIAVIAVVALDGMALFSANQSVRDDSASAAREALTEYTQSGSIDAAKLAAEAYLAKSGLKLVSFSAQPGLDGAQVFTVTSQANAHTYVFKYLRYVPGLKKWVARTTHPVGTQSSD